MIPSLHPKDETVYEISSFFSRAIGQISMTLISDSDSSNLDDESLVEVTVSPSGQESDIQNARSVHALKEIEHAFELLKNHQCTFHELVSKLQRTLNIENELHFEAQETLVQEVRESLDQKKKFELDKDDEFVLGIEMNGVYISGNLIQSDCHCENLIHCDFNSSRKLLTQKSYQKHLTFSNKLELSTFLGIFELIGLEATLLNIDGDIKTMYFSFKKSKDQLTNHFDTHSYISVHVVPVCDIEISAGRIRLSTGAHQQLEEILSLLQNGFLVNAAMKVKDFFRIFGSHVYMKNIVLGGYLILQTDCRDPGNENYVHDLHKEMFDKILMSLCSTEDLTQFDIPDLHSRHVSKRKGGASIKSTLPFWEMLLRTHPSLHRAISYGSFCLSDFKGIWDVIKGLNLFQPQNEAICCFLQRVWIDSQRNNIYVSRQEGSLPPSQFNKCLRYIKQSLSKQKATYLLSNLCSEVQNSYAPGHNKWIRHIEREGILNSFIELVPLEHGKGNSNEEICIHLINLMHSTSMFLLPNGRKAFFSVMEYVIQNSDHMKILSKGHSDESFLTKTMSMIIKGELMESTRKRQFCRFLTMLNELNNIGIDFDFRSESCLTIPNWEQVKWFFNSRKDANQNGENDLNRQIAMLIDFIIEPKKQFIFSQMLEVTKYIPLGINPMIREILQNENKVAKQKTWALKDLLKSQRKFCATIQWDYFEKMDANFFFSIGRANKIIRSSMNLNIPPNVYEVLNFLKLTDKYPGKISIQELQSHVDVLFREPENFSDIPFAFLRKIVSVDFSFREHVIGDLLRKHDKTDTDFLSDGIYEENTVSEIENSIHPSDVFLAIYLCSDMHLQKVLAQKVAACQFALPLIHQAFEDNSLIAITWPLRDVMICNERRSAYSSKLPIVSFIRIGNCKFCSKSKLINDFLRDENEMHATFFNRESSFGRRNRKISNGIIEISWFVPSKSVEISKVGESEENLGEENTAGFHKENAAVSFYTKPFTILNLRGDGDIYRDHLKILCEISDIIVVLVDFERFSNPVDGDTFLQINGSEKKVILLTNIMDREKARVVVSKLKDKIKMDKRRTKMISLYDCITESYMNTSEMKFKLSKALFGELNNTTNTPGLETVISKVTLPLIIDEHDTSCTRGKKMASLVFESLKEAGSKANALPLQGEDLWQTLSKLEKKRNRVGNIRVYENKETLLTEIKHLKEKQFKRMPNKYFSIFVKTLCENADKPLIIQFFLSWLRLFLDESSRDKQFEKQKLFRKAFLRYQNEKTDENASLLDYAEQQLSSCSFGLEHCFREIGQVYESYQNMKKLTQKQIEEKSVIVFHYLPTIVARLLLLGQPFELMDGDAANVPQNWIKAVFSELKKQIGDANVFTVSVLGIQSSGKSTLLNSMFGLQFAVSAGRCTRGIYAQLVPVKSTELSLNCEYILIIDTEGLRAPELSERKVHHDNELATLVIGMADYTIINIKGENLAEVENVLQIVVHALLRCKQANRELQLKHSCILVHQNVSAQDAEKQMQQGHHKTIQNLDNIAKEVAISEHLSTEYKSFSDIIHFDPRDSIIYVPELWHGTPPMAPVNTKYSSKVTEITKHMLEAASRKECLSLSDTFDHFKSLWEGILKEDFVFSFRNCLEVKAYSILESEYQRLVWNLEETHLKWFDKKARPLLSRCESEIDLDTSANDLVCKFVILIGEKREKMKKELVDFMEKSSLKEQMIQWRENKLLQMHSLVSNMKNCVRQKVENKKNQNKIELSSKNILHLKEKQIRNKAQELANSFRGTNPNDTEQNEAFETMWIQWLSEIEKQFPQASNVKRISDLKGSMEDTLYEVFAQHSPLLMKELEKKPLDYHVQYESLQGSFTLYSREHLVPTKLFDKLKNVFMPSDIVKFEKMANQFIDTELNSVDKEIKRLSEEDKECTISEFKVILNILSELFSTHKTFDLDYKFNHFLQIELTLHVSRYVFSRFRVINITYFEKTSVKAKLQEYKPKVLQFFHDIVDAKTNEIATANLLCSKLEDTIFQKVMLDVAVKVKGHVRSSFSYKKYHLTKDILEDICKQSDFKVYMEYITNPKTFSLNWLRDFVNETIFDRKGANTFYVWAEEGLNDISSEILASLREISRDEANFKSFDSWTAVFVRRIGPYCSLRNKSLTDVKDCDVTDVRNFHSCVVDSLKEMERRIKKKFSNVNAKNVTWIDGSPVQNIFNSLWGCEELCPWCREPCLHEADHLIKHRCIQHRPSGIGGTKWRPSLKLSIESCNFEVQSTQFRYCSTWCGCKEDGCNKSHPCKEYIKYMPNWDIAPQTDMSASNYWTWVMCEFKDNLAKHYYVEPPDIPQSWMQVTQKDAIDSLSIYEA